MEGGEENNEKEISNLLHREFKVMVIRMLIKFGKRMKKQNINKEKI